MEKEPTKRIKESYRCPICNHPLPVHHLVGEVIVFCRYCKNSVRVSIKATETDGENGQDNHLGGGDVPEE